MSWISIDDELPKTAELVLISTQYGVGVAHYNPLNGWGPLIVNFFHQHGDTSVTHWMPLPEPPVIAG
ncbi:DUF551 domain-containing protein [Cedecea davisae]|uniref:DUF551 domain-containing protein n=1 Tax=Cedecea davisae TaxID=158484 RepID=A0ABS6DHQ2_9ENTR|nr:DUF551 domain-containing protein [Cedecea davisae]MBU4686293.1 DUF551 domain-containing protein [Cedecea davisae]